MGLGFKELKEHETGVWDAQILALILQWSEWPGVAHLTFLGSTDSPK